MQIANNHLTLTVAHRGAEPVSLRAGDREYLWQGNPAYWKRHAPILFPIVGKVFDNTYRVGTQEYHLPQHGFARDRDFDLIGQTDDSLTFQLASDDETLLAYPYPFILTAYYRLNQSQLCCQWTLENPADQDMYFMLGAHPAFNYPQFDPADSVFGHMAFFLHDQPVTQLTVTRLSQQGYALADQLPLPLPEGQLLLTPYTFRHDALVIEGRQADRVVMHDKQRRPFLEVTFDAPVFGLWSPVGAPFCCIEPWYGRTDEEGFAGTIEQRQHIQRLEPHKTFSFKYNINILK